MRRSARKLLQHIGRERPSAPDRRVAAHDHAGPPPDLPVARYDHLPADSVLAHLDQLALKDLAKLGDHERRHQNRARVLAEIDARLGHEPWPGYDALDVDGVRFGLEGAEYDRFTMVLAYERAHRNRAGVVLAAQQHAA
jgi:hypothetical protein